MAPQLRSIQGRRLRPSLARPNEQGWPSAEDARRSVGAEDFVKVDGAL